MGYKLTVASWTPENFINIANLVSQHPPFSQYGFAAMLSTLSSQLQHKSHICVTKDDQLVGYAGWMLTNTTAITNWLNNNEDPVPDWDHPEAALVNITVSNERKAIAQLVRGISDGCAGLPVYRKRTFQGDRKSHKRPPIMGRKQFSATETKQLEFQSEQRLIELLTDVYQRTDRNIPAKPFPMTFIDSPEVAFQIFRNHQIFEKDYDFLEDFAKGRFSANGEEWEQRQALTQTFYSKATDLKNPDAVYDIYCRHLTSHPIHSPQELYNVFLSAATEVVLRAFGIREDIGWDANHANKILKLLQIRQAISWSPALNSFSQVSVKALKEERVITEERFFKSPEGAKFLNILAKSMMLCPSFSPVEELAQNLLAATETTASSLSWAVELLSKQPELQQHLRINNDPESVEFKGFLNEMWRLYPPVPIVTRKANQDFKQNQMKFKKDQHMLVSIIGLHTHPDYWTNPLVFNPERPEFMNDSYDRKAFLPFLAGTRSCGGRKLGKMEVEQGIRALLHCFDLKQDPGPSRINYVTTLRPVFSSSFRLDSR
ncbi:cytochrome P450 [Endozoicomonas numazuensis]|uniref:Cytochrome P450 n=1 Tax=Endozoicomonas numazuensis TaxID=1137799 RepID=A0A081NFI5_9GAMM|nr:cytochrome P450 [Endozoicomonas numazuensis]KEQ17208.1 hypothetical protein GZ78_15340 [Endozoicomonas numazuensis]